MRAHQILLTVLVALAACDAISLSLPSLFGSLVSSPVKEAEIDEEASEPAEITEEDTVKDEEDDLIEYHDPKAPQKKPTKKPLFGIIPHPADHPLHPHNNPHHPLHPDNLHLPHLPHLPLPHLPAIGHGHKETIHATKTVYAEVTDRVTIHPVCMTVAHGVKPPCLPFVPEHHYVHPHHHGHHHHGHLHHPHHHFGHGHGHGHPLHHRDDEAKIGEPLQIQPTAAVTLDEPTRILGGATFSDGETVDAAESSEAYADDLGAESVRSARYVEITPSITAPDTVQIKEEPELTEEEKQRTPLDMVQNLFHDKPVTHYKTKTLWVTKVDKVLDTRVTATLIAKNCIPTNSHIPWCSNHHLGVYGPGFHGHHSEHNYHGGAHGHFQTTVHTEKDEQLNSDNNIQEDNDYEKSLDEEESRTEEPDYAETGLEQRESGSGDAPVTE